MLLPNEAARDRCLLPPGTAQKRLEQSIGNLLPRPLEVELFRKYWKNTKENGVWKSQSPVLKKDI